MLPYIILAVVGVFVLFAGVILIILRKKVVGIVLTAVGVLAALAGAFLTVCTFILVDYIHNKPADNIPEPQVQEVTVVTEEPPYVYDTEDTRVDGGDTGSDWRTWRSCSEDFIISDKLTVCLSPLDDLNGYAVYDCSDGSRTATLINDTDAALELWEIRTNDADRDGVYDLGIVLDNGETLWFGYNGKPYSDDNTAGCFERIED